jgi:hypothetical protein
MRNSFYKPSTLAFQLTSPTTKVQYTTSLSRQHPNPFYETGNTLLMLASYANHIDLTKSLLARGADPNRLNDRGQSILAGAVFKANDEVARVLVEEGGADARLGTPSAVETARLFRRREMFELLGVDEGEEGEGEGK